MMPPKGGDSTSPVVPFLRKKNVTSTDVDGVSCHKEGICRAIHCRRSSSFFRRAHIAATGIECVSLQIEGRCRANHRRRPSPFFGTTKTLDGGVVVLLQSVGCCGRLKHGGAPLRLPFFTERPRKKRERRGNQG